MALASDFTSGGDCHSPPGPTNTVTRSHQKGSRRFFWGLLYAQAAGTVLAALIMAAFFGFEALLAALWGGVICLLGYGWGGFQIGWRSGDGSAGQIAGRAVYALVGKWAVFMVLFALSFRFEPRLHRPEMFGAMLAGFVGAQLTGWIIVARRSGVGTGEDVGNQDR
jgi:hypothetical protein